MQVITNETSQQIPVREWRTDETVSAVLLVRAADRRHKRDGAPWLRLILADRSATVPAILWDADGLALEPGDAVQVSGRFADHDRYGPQLTIDELHRAPLGVVPWDALLDGPTRPVAELCEDLDRLVGSIQDPHLARLIGALLDPSSPTGAAYRIAPAAKYNHHAYRSGLLEHSVEIAQLVSAAAALFDDLDRDVAVCGALLHDIGKLDAYAGQHGCTDLTDAGKLEGEIALGYYRVRREIEAIPGFPAELARALLHVILAHHGCLEYGSPVVPGTREATLVHAIDELSGQLGAFARLAKDTPPGERWSGYDRALGTRALLDHARPRVPRANRSPVDGEDLALARAFIATCPFTVARTVPEHPHEYCLRDRVDGEAFDHFVALIAAHGYPGRFWDQDWTYLNVDDHKYWQSRTIDGTGAIVNRARLDHQPSLGDERT